MIRVCKTGREEGGREEREGEREREKERERERACQGNPLLHFRFFKR